MKTETQLLSCSHNNNILEFLLTLRFAKETINNAADVGYLKWLTYMRMSYIIKRLGKNGKRETKREVEGGREGERERHRQRDAGNKTNNNCKRLSSWQK